MADAGDLDLNFCYPIDASKLWNDKLKLVPFDTNLSLLSSHYVTHTSHPTATANFRYLPYGPFYSVDDFLAWYNRVIRPSRAVVWFAILLSEAGAAEVRRQHAVSDEEVEELEDMEAMKLQLEGETKASYFAGSIGLLNAATENAVCEIGHINILPPYQRTYTSTHANALLLSYLLDHPPHGLALRRVTWLANALNTRSVAAAQRLGFKLEGWMRWHRILVEEKEGKRVEGDGRGPGRDTALLAICWDDWMDGVRERMRRLVER